MSEEKRLPPDVELLEDDDPTVTQHRNEHYLFQRPLGDDTVHYINAKVTGEPVTTIYEATSGYDEAKKVRDDLKQEFPKAILWVADTPTADWRRKKKRNKK